MDSDALHRAWVAQAQADADRGVIECRICKRHSQLDETITLWRNGFLVFAVCDRCCGCHDIAIRPTDAGIEVRGVNRGPLVIRGAT
jgi:hypothetical protein